MIKKLLGITLGLAVASSLATAQTIAPPGPTVAQIKQRGQLNCGTDTGIPVAVNFYAGQGAGRTS